ncbi:MAG: hypothetical protein HFJ91_00600 [Muribaculaceae bacterium]|nr:hypothetical protein [Muribaculaceae bacterium]
MRQLAILALASMLLCSCSATKYVPVETVRTEKEEVTRWRTDTVTQGDTRLIYIKGDTVIDRRERWRERVREVRDTVYVERTDSIPVPYPVEKELSRWERTKVDWGGWAMGALGVVIVTFVWLRKRRTQ